MYFSSIIFIMFLILTVPVGAAVPGSTSGQFLKIASGARASGMGEAFVGLSDNIDAIMWNPSGLVQIEGVQQTFMHNAWFEGINTDYLAFGLPVGKKYAVGAGIEYVNVGEIGRIDKYGESLGTYNANSIMGILSLARKVGKRFSAGVTIKTFRETIENENASGIAFDAGAMYYLSGIRLGCVVSNLGGSVMFREEAYPLPLNIRMGAAIKANKSLTITSDINLPSDNQANLHVGGEYRYGRFKNMEISLRGGFKTNTISYLEVLSGISAGFGLSWSEWGIDYAMAPYGLLGISHRINLTMKFSKPAQRKVEIIGIKGKKREIVPQDMYNDALKWFKEKAVKEKLNKNEQVMLLEKIRDKFKVLEVDVSAVKEMIKAIEK